MSRKTKAGMRIVSRREYALTKASTLLSSGGMIACGIGIALLLLNLPYSNYLDTQAEAGLSFHQSLYGDGPFIDASLGAFFLCFFLIPPLVLFVIAFWFGGRKDRRILPLMEPSATADTYGLPISRTLLRATEITSSEQQAELLRAVQEGKQTPQEELLRAIQTRE